MNGGREKYLLPILVIALGVAWLSNVLDVYPALDWIWTIGLAAVGILMLVVGGLNNKTVVIGPALIPGPSALS